MRKKNYKGAKVSKRVVAKCEGVCRTYDAIQYAYANLLSETEEVKSFQVNVLLQGLEEGAYTSDFVITKADGNLMVRECVSRKHLTKPMTTKLLDVSRNYWKSHGVSDWGIVIEEGCRHMNKADMRKGMLLKIKIAAKKKSVEEAQKAYLVMQEECTERKTQLAWMERAFLDEQAGILAKVLKTGEPCPVCGSVHHLSLIHISEPTRPY